MQVGDYERIINYDWPNDESRISNYVYLTELIHSPMTAKEIEQYSKCDPILVKVDLLLFTPFRSFISMYTAGNSRFLLTINHY